MKTLKRNLKKQFSLYKNQKKDNEDIKEKFEETIQPLQESKKTDNNQPLTVINEENSTNKIDDSPNDLIYEMQPYIEAFQKDYRSYLEMFKAKLLLLFWIPNILLNKQFNNKQLVFILMKVMLISFILVFFIFTNGFFFVDSKIAKLSKSFKRLSTGENLKDTFVISVISAFTMLLFTKLANFTSNTFNAYCYFNIKAKKKERKLKDQKILYSYEQAKYMLEVGIKNEKPNRDNSSYEKLVTSIMKVKEVGKLNSEYSLEVIGKNVICRLRACTIIIIILGLLAIDFMFIFGNIFKNIHMILALLTVCSIILNALVVVALCAICAGLRYFALNKEMEMLYWLDQTISSCL